MAPGLVEPAVPAPSTSALASVTAEYDDTLRFYLNGTRVVLDNADPEVTLLEYLRGVGLTGTKLGCAEGGCGACTVVVSQWNPTTNSIYHASVNACLAPLVSVDGKHVVTVEALGDPSKPHPVQERIAKMNGSQCGFCTPGIVMVCTPYPWRAWVPWRFGLRVISKCSATKRWIANQVASRVYMPFCETTPNHPNTMSKRPLMATSAAALDTGQSWMQHRASAQKVRVERQRLTVAAAAAWRRRTGAAARMARMV